MSYKEMALEELINKLETAGRYPEFPLIRAVWSRKEETCAPLLHIFREAYHDSWPRDDDSRWYRFLHAGKFMLAWRIEDALPTFADLYMNDELQDLCEWFEEDVADYGPVAIPHFTKVLQMDTKGEWHYGRSLSGSILTQIALQHPGTWDEVIAIFRSLLPSVETIADLTEEDHDGMWSTIASELAILQDQESREQILALFDADLMDESYIDREGYLRELDAKHRQKSNKRSYNLLTYYKDQYDWHLKEQKRIEAENQQQIRSARTGTAVKIGRNAPCPCGSGKKYKKCHGRPGM